MIWLRPALLTVTLLTLDTDWVWPTSLFFLLNVTRQCVVNGREQEAESQQWRGVTEPSPVAALPSKLLLLFIFWRWTKSEPKPACATFWSFLELLLALPLLATSQQAGFILKMAYVSGCQLKHNVIP